MSLMNEPTRLGSVGVAGRPGARRFIFRMDDLTPGPWHWRDAESEAVYRWEDLIDPRPATEQEIEERRVIEP